MFEKFGRENSSLRLSSTPGARSPSSAPKTGAGAWVMAGDEDPAAVVVTGAAVVADAPLCDCVCTGAVVCFAVGCVLLLGEPLLPCAPLLPPVHLA